MEIWLETLDFETIEKAKRMGVLHGITTTPALLATGNPREILSKLLKVQVGPVAVEITSYDQGKSLFEFSTRLLIKIPATEQGWEMMHDLKKDQIPVMASGIVQPTQVLLAALAGATYVAPNFSRILKSGDNPFAQLESMKKIIGSMKTRILAANPKTIEQIRVCAELGLDAMTIREDVFRDLIETHELTAFSVEQYADDWKKIGDLL